MGRPREIDDKLVWRMRNASPPTPIDAIAKWLGVTPSAIYASLRRTRTGGRVAEPAVTTEQVVAFIEDAGADDIKAIRLALFAREGGAHG